MFEFKFRKNPFLIFSPFLVFFIFYALIYHHDLLEGDESRYIMFAQNLLHGFYSPSAPDINLWNGPGYPIILIPFIALKLPLIYITLINAVFQYLSIVFLFKALHEILSFKKSILFSLFWAFCYSTYQYISMIYTETLMLFLISLLIYFIVNAFKNDRINKYVYLSGVILGYIVITKIIFGYVLQFFFLVSIILLIGKLRSSNYRKGVIIILIAILIFLPYLIYTYNLTGKFFYWGNSGGMSLYWMSSPYKNEYGGWNNENFTANLIDGNITNTDLLLKLNHQKDIDTVLKYKGVRKDDAYKQIAIRNIKNNPTKYFKNIISNISRLFFGFPEDYSLQRPLLKMWYFSILYSLMLYCLLVSLINWKKLPYYIRFIFAFIFTYLGLSSLVSAGNRQFVIIIPILLFWIAYILHKSLKFNLKFDNK